MELKSIKIRWVGGVSWNIHMNCTIKKDKIVLVVPPFSSSVSPPNTFFPGTALNFYCNILFIFIKGQGTVWAVLGPSSVFRGFYIKS